MPLIYNTQNERVRMANTVMARAFFPRFKASLFSQLCASYISNAMIEPHALLGAVPGLQLYNGRLDFANVPSFNFNVPNQLFKAGLEISRQSFEMDQTGTFGKLGGGMGARLAEFPDQLFCNDLINASTANSQTQSFNGANYTMTLDNQPFFSASHSDWYSGGTQSNIIAGGLPATKALFAANTNAVNAQFLQQDLALVLDAITNVRDNAGLPFYPTIDAKESIVIVGPRIMEPALNLAFAAAGSVVNQTTNNAPMFVKKVLTSGYLGGNFVSPRTGLTVNPPNPTDYYVFVSNDWIKPWYFQMFQPLGDNDLFPRGYDSAAEVDRLLASKSTVPIDNVSAAVFASAMVETTFNKVGANADAFTIQNEKFLMASRWRGNMVPGMWFTGFRVRPTTGNA